MKAIFAFYQFRLPILLSLVYLLNLNFEIKSQTNTWRVVPGAEMSEIRRIVAAGDDMYIIGYGIARTTDGGESWKQITNYDNGTPPGGYDLWMQSGEKGIAVSYSEIYTTNDGWLTGKRTASVSSSKCIAMIDNNNGFVGGNWGSLYQTTDGGQTWIDRKQDPNLYNNDFKSISFNTPLSGHAVGEFYFKTTTDGGENWTLNTSVPYYANFNRIGFANSSTGWIIGSSGEILKSTNGGESWFSQTSNTKRRLNGLGIINSEEAIIVGDSGIVLITSNGGNSWNGVDVGTSEHLNDILVKTNGEVWIVGTGDLILTNKQKPLKVTLNTSVWPSEAASDGCTVTPNGSSDYSLNYLVSLDAKAAAGWVWDQWTGDLSGNDKPQFLVMDSDKNVTANFQPLLNLGFVTPPAENHCLPSPSSEINIGNANIFVDGVDWQLNAINFSVVEKFKPEYAEAWIEYNGTKLKGIINVDAEGYASSLSFSPSVLIAEGSTLTVKLYYLFNYPSKANDKYIPPALTEVKKLAVSINVTQLDCEPVPEGARPGVKTPAYPPAEMFSSTQTVASVWNVSKSPEIPFGTIKEAVESEQTTENDSIKLCTGWYYENVSLSKALTIFSSVGFETTVWEGVQPANSNYPSEKLLTITKSNTNISGISFKKGAPAISITGSAGKIKHCTIIKNYFFEDNSFAVNSQSADSCTVKENTTYSWIVFRDSDINYIEKNSFFNRLSFSGASKANIVSENVFLSNKAGIEVDKLASNIEIVKNMIGVRDDGITPGEALGTAIKIEGYSNYIEDNVIGNCLNIGIELSGAQGNTIKNNIFGLGADKRSKMTNQTSIYLINGCENNIIESNILCQSAVGIKLESKYLSSGMPNIKTMIRGNFFGTNDSYETGNQFANMNGIIINSGNIENIIEGNTFGNNGFSITIGGSRNELNNNMFGTDPSGNIRFFNPIGVVLTSEGNTVSQNVFANSSICISLGTNENDEEQVCRGNKILNNSIGTDIKGEKSIPVSVGMLLIGKTNNNIIEENIFGNILTASIQLNGKNSRENLIRNNYFGTNKSFTNTFYFRRGIVLFQGANRNSILFNTIGGSAPDSSRGILLMYSSNKNIIRSNYLGTDKTGTAKIPNFVGIVAEESSNDNSITQNKVWYNYAGIEEFDSKNLITQNDIRYNTHNTGIHLHNSSSQITGNKILDDLGDAIKCENGSNPLITLNNFSGNAGFAVNNLDRNITINAQGNYWGNSSGPGSSINGNIDAGFWLESESNLILGCESDTIFLTESGKDSVSIFYYNWNNPNDLIDIDIKCTKDNLMISDNNFTANLSLPNSGESRIVLNAPSATNETETAYLYIHANSRSDPSLMADDTLTAVMYNRILSSFLIAPDSVVCMPGDTVMFNLTGLDQYNKEMELTEEITWMAEGGTIDSSGQYVAGSTEGIFYVTALVGSRAINVKSVVNIGNVTDVHRGSESSNLPTEYALKQNYPNPFNPSTTIKYNVPASETLHATSLQHISLKIFDLLGREVATLVNEEQAPGYYAIKFDGSKIASGIYLYKLQAGSYSSAKKLMLLK